MELLFDSRIGRGLFGDVWLAKDKLARSVAVKFFDGPNPGQLERNALDHAKALVRVRHPAVVQVLAVEKQVHPETGAEALCIVMEYAEGPNLSLHGSPLTMEHARAMIRDVCGALQAIHEVGLVHGDLHDANVVVTPNGAKVIDILYTNSLAEVGTTRANKERVDDYRALALVIRKILDKAGCDKPALEEAYYRANEALVSVEAVQRPFADMLSRRDEVRDPSSTVPSSRDAVTAVDGAPPRSLAPSERAEHSGSADVPRDVPENRGLRRPLLLAAIGACFLVAALGLIFRRRLFADTATSVVYDAQEQRCKAGDRKACLDQGYSLYAGQGVEKDAERAVEIFTEACEAGEPNGCVSLGWAHYTGTGAKKDPAAAAAEFAKACDDTVAVGCYGLSILYRDGVGVPKDRTRAAELLKKGCDAGFAPGCKQDSPKP